MPGFPEVAKANTLAELSQQCLAWSWAESLITNKIAWSLCYPPSTCWWGCLASMKASAQRCVLEVADGEDTLLCSLKDFCQEILDRRKMFIISDIFKYRQLGRIFFPVPSAFSSSTLAPSSQNLILSCEVQSQRFRWSLLHKAWTFPLSP